LIHLCFVRASSYSTNLSKIRLTDSVLSEKELGGAMNKTLESLSKNTNTQQHSALILIADDDRFTRMLLRQIMEEEGYQVQEVADGEQCLSAYRELQPDMVLLMR
jgi:PleD family two-component response regulator